MRCAASIFWFQVRHLRSKLLGRLGSAGELLCALGKPLSDDARSPATFGQPECVGQVRQHGNSGLHQLPGRTAIPEAVPPDEESVAGGASPHLAQGNACGWSVEHRSGHAAQGPSVSPGLATTGSSGRGLAAFQEGAGGSLCFPGNDALSPMVLPDRGGRPTGRGRSGPQLAENSVVRLPSKGSHSSSFGDSGEGGHELILIAPCLPDRAWFAKLIVLLHNEPWR